MVVAEVFWMIRYFERTPALMIAVLVDAVRVPLYADTEVCTGGVLPMDAVPAPLITVPMELVPAGIEGKEETPKLVLAMVGVPEIVTDGVPEIVAVTESLPLERFHVRPVLHVPLWVAAKVLGKFVIDAERVEATLL